MCSDGISRFSLYPLPLFLLVSITEMSIFFIPSCHIGMEFYMNWIYILIKSATTHSKLSPGWSPKSWTHFIWKCSRTLIFVALCSIMSVSSLYYTTLFFRGRLKVFLRGLCVSSFLDDSNSADIEELELEQVFWVRSRLMSIEKSTNWEH